MWDFASDVFSSGVVGIRVFRKEREKSWSIVDRETHKDWTAALREDATDISELLSQMLPSRPTDRIAMREVLLKAFWPDPPTPFDRIKRKFPFN